MRVGLGRMAAMALVVTMASGAVRAQTDFPHAPISLPDGVGEAEFHLFNDMAVITVRRANGQIEPLKLISDVDDALAVLADRRLSFAWPAVIAWAGSDLTLLRDRAVARNKAAVEMGLPTSPAKMVSEAASGDSRISATLQYARVLEAAGRTGEANALLRQRIAAAADATGKNMREFLTIRLGWQLFDAGDAPAAIALLEKESADPQREATDHTNLDINLAAMLVRTGSYQRGLVLINQVWAQFSQQPDEDAVNFKVPESEAQFAWIRACALDGLGSHVKARALLDAIVSKTPADRGRMTTAASTRISYFLCTRDGPGLAREMARQFDTAWPANPLFDMIQPSSPPVAGDRATLAVALRQPVLIGAIRTKARLLEPDFTSAVSGWRTRAAPKP